MPGPGYPNPTNLSDIPVIITVVSLFSTFFSEAASTNQKVRLTEQMGKTDGHFDGEHRY
jgi:hypothetical protein